jgi:hypothetical protein
MDRGLCAPLLYGDCRAITATAKGIAGVGAVRMQHATRFAVALAQSSRRRNTRAESS